jgi:hypothetical protein
MSGFVRELKRSRGLVSVVVLVVLLVLSVAGLVVADSVGNGSLAVGLVAGWFVALFGAVGSFLFHAFED